MILDHGDKDERSAILRAAELVFLISNDTGGDRKGVDIKNELLSIIRSNSMIGYYKHILQVLGWEPDDELIGSMIKDLRTKEEEIERAIEEAKEEYGETEIAQAKVKQMTLKFNHGSKREAHESFQELDKKSIGIGIQFDYTLKLFLIGYAYGDRPFMEKRIHEAKQMAAESAVIDFERKNRLKVFEGFFSLLVRDFEKASLLFIDSIATFGALELFSFRTFVRYTVLSALVGCGWTGDRQTLKDKVVENPDVLSVIGEMPELKNLVDSLYRCRYHEILYHLGVIVEQLKSDYILFEHRNVYCKKMRVVAYRQYLVAYQTVALKTMAEAFSVPVDFIENELFEIINRGELNCKLDGVEGMIRAKSQKQRSLMYSRFIEKADDVLHDLSTLNKKLLLYIDFQ